MRSIDKSVNPYLQIIRLPFSIVHLPSPRRQGYCRLQTTVLLKAILKRTG